jgi:drug/metabolite transporter (DMT)-like permease
MFSKIALESGHVTPMGLIAYRFLLAFIIFEVLRLLKVVRIRFQKEFFIPVFLVALFQPILYFVFETYGLNLTTSSEAGMMIALIPIFVTILSTFILKEKPTLLQVIFILVSLSGIVIIQSTSNNGTGSSSLLGIFLLMLAVISAALFNIASRSASKKVKAYEITYFMMLSGAVTFNVIYLVQLGFSGEISSYFSNFAHIDVFLPILYLGVIASIGGFFLVNFALGELPAHVSSIYANLSTVVAVLAGHFILGDSLGIYTIIGGLMIIAGVYGVARINFRNQVKGDLND